MESMKEIMHGELVGDPRIIDTHAHYDDEAFDEDRESVITSLPSSGVYAAVNMGAELRGARDSAALAEKYPHIYAGIGVHPDHVGCMSDAVMAELHSLAQSPKCVCIGEIGLDYHWDIEPRDVQQKWFAEQIHLAQELNLPFNVHSRNAAQDTFDIIKREDNGRAGGIIHCYSGSREMAREYIKMGYYLGIGGAVTFKNSKTLKKVVEDSPIEFLVTETDCPYMTPEPFRGRRNTSAHITHVIDAIAQIKGMEREMAERILLENARRVYTRIR